MRFSQVSLYLYLVLALVLASSMTVAAASTITIKMDAQAHTPTDNAEPTKENPNPIRAIRDIADEYEALHPDVNIEFIKVPEAQGRESWLQARMMAKDAPDVFWLNFDMTWNNYQKGWFKDLTPYLKRPNPYVEGNERWEDMFVEGILDAVRAPDGRIYDIAADGVGVGVYYNKSIFAEVGAKTPNTWSEFTDVQKRIQEAGYTPFVIQAGPNNVYMHWVDGIVQSQLIYDTFHQWDRDDNGFVDIPEVCLAVDEGAYPDVELMKEMWQLIKDWSQYWPRGFTSDIDVLQTFAAGQGAMMLEGSWALEMIKGLEPDFEVGVFQLPVVTKDLISEASEVPSRIYGPWGPGQWIIPGYLPDDRTEMVIDWLMFLAKPENIARLANDHGGAIPNITAAADAVSPELSGFMEDIPTQVIQGFTSVIDNTFADRYYSTMQLYLSGTISLDQFIEQSVRYYKEGARRMLRQNPDWRK